MDRRATICGGARVDVAWFSRGCGVVDQGSAEVSVVIALGVVAYVVGTPTRSWTERNTGFRCVVILVTGLSVRAVV